MDLRNGGLEIRKDEVSQRRGRRKKSRMYDRVGRWPGAATFKKTKQAEPKKKRKWNFQRKGRETSSTRKGIPAESNDKRLDGEKNRKQLILLSFSQKNC